MHSKYIKSPMFAQMLVKTIGIANNHVDCNARTSPKLAWIVAFFVFIHDFIALGATSHHFHDRLLLTVLNLKLPYAAHCWFPAYFGLVPSRGFARTSSGCASSKSSRSFRTNFSSPWRRTLTTLLSFFLLKAIPPNVRGHQRSVPTLLRADN